MRSALGERVDRLRRVAGAVGWVATENLHITLKFLGQVEVARLPSIEAALARAAADVRPFELAFVGLGAFPAPTRPRVIWAGVAEGREPIARLAEGVERELGALGFAPEGRPFSAHVTLGRVREPRRDPKLAEALGAAAAERIGSMRVERVSLMRSELSPRGARYTEISAHPLG